MTEGKYIIYADGDVQVFESTQIHLWKSEAHGGTAVRAGKFYTDNGVLRTGGVSTTLDLRGEEEDAGAVSEALKASVEGV